MNYKIKSCSCQEGKSFRIILITFFTITISLFCSTGSSAQNEVQHQETSILGEWFPLDTSKGGLGAAITFSSDGKVETIFGAYVTYKYLYESDTLTLEFPNTPKIKNKVTIDKTKLVVSNKDTVLTRISSDPNSGIIGKWEGKHYTGRKQIIRYTASQNAYLSVPMKSTEETFNIKGDIVEFSGESERTYQWFVDGDKLILKTNDAGKIYNYIRVK